MSAIGRVHGVNTLGAIVGAGLAGESASDVLLAAAASGDLWLDADVLRDGSVMAKLLTGDRAGARDAFVMLAKSSARGEADLRSRLLYSYIANPTSARSLAARP